MTLLAVASMALAVFVGAMAQRTTGLGFALVAAPLLVVIAGPVAGVSMANVLSAVLCLVVLAGTWRDVRWKRALLLLVPSVLGVHFGAQVAMALPPALLLVSVGGLCLAALAVTAFSRKLRLLPGRTGALAAGALSGFMNATAGVGGPALAIHAVSERWPREMLIGTGQVFLLGVNIMSVIAKGLPTPDPVAWIAAGAALAAGAFAGHFLNKRINIRTGQRLVLMLAFAGSAAAVVRGVLLLQG